MNWVLIAFGAVFAGLGSLVLWAMSREFALLGRMRREGVATTGVVVRHVRKDKGIDLPVIQFADRRGQQVEFSPDPVRLHKFVAQGERFPVTYLEDRPHEAKLAGSETRRRGLLAGGAVGAVFLGVGVLVLGAAVVDTRGELPNETADVEVEPGSVLAWVYVVGAILSCGFPVWLFARSLRSLLVLRREGVRTTGTVLRVYRADKAGWWAVVEFFDLGGRRIQFTCRSSKRSSNTVRVLYPPGSPEDAQHDRLTPIVVPLVALSIFGLVILCSMGYAMVK